MGDARLTAKAVSTTGEIWQITYKNGLGVWEKLDAANGYTAGVSQTSW